MASLKYKGIAGHGALDTDTIDPSDAYIGQVDSGLHPDSAVPASVANAMPLAGAVTVEGTGGDDTLVVTATGTDSGSYSLNGGTAIAFNHLTSFTFNGGNGNDNMTVVNPDGGLFAPTGGVFVHGGTQNGGAGDGLAIVGGAQDTAVYSTDAHHADGKDGSIVLSHGAVTATYSYTGLEPLANTGNAANIVFNLPAGADDAILEDVGNFNLQLRSANGTFETTVFSPPTASLTINSGTGDTLTIDTTRLFLTDLTVGSLTNAAVNPDAIKVSHIDASFGRVTLAATGAITEAANHGPIDILAGTLLLSAGTGIGVADPIETSVGTLEARTNTGGIFINNIASVFNAAPTLFIGGQYGTAALTGLSVATSGNIEVSNAGTINLADQDGAQAVLGGSVSGDVTLSANGATSDFTSLTVEKAIMAPAGSVEVDAGRDISFVTAGVNLDFDNDVRANGNISLFADRDVVIDGDADIVADAFGHDTQGGVTIVSGFAGNGRVSIENTASTGVDGGASVGAAGRGGVTIRTGFGGANSFTNQRSVFGSAVTIQSDSQDFQAGSSITATHGPVYLGISSYPINADLGSTAAGFNFSQAELNTITASVLTIAPTGNITISRSITLDPLKVPTLVLEALGQGAAGRIIDGTATEQADLTVKNLMLQARGSIGTAADAIDVHVGNLAFLNNNPSGAANPVVNISNTGPLTIGAIAGAPVSENDAGDTTITTTGALTVGVNVKTVGRQVLQTVDSAASGQDLTVLPGVTVESGGDLFLVAGDNIDLRAGSTVKAPALVELFIDAGNADAGVGAIANVNGTLLTRQTGITGNGDADTFNIAPSANSEIYIGAGNPNTLAGDTLTVNNAGATGANLGFTFADSGSKYGEYDFANRQLINFTGVETLNTVNGPLTVSGTGLNDALTVHTTGHNTGSFTLTGPYAFIDDTGPYAREPINYFGVDAGTATYGQVITADATHTRLSAFTFEMDLPATVAFRGEIYAWDGTKAVGPALFESAVTTTSGTGLQDITFNTGGVTLTSGQQYVLFASTSGEQSGHSGRGPWQGSDHNIYSGGQFVYLDNGDDASAWTTRAWSTDHPIDLAFTAAFDQSVTSNFSNLTSFVFNGKGGHDSYSAAANINTVLDFDANSHSDILWRNDSGDVVVWDNGRPSGAHSIATVSNSWHIADTGDFDGNARSDILWRNDDGAVGIWDNGQTSGAHSIATVSNDWHIAGTGDFDGNGRSDVLWTNDNGAVGVWANGQTSGAHSIATVSNDWHIAATGDFDGNGRSDILWYADNGAVGVWDNGQTSGAHSIATVSNDWHIAGTGDFDGNGRSDILWYADNGAVGVWDNGQTGGAHLIAGAGAVPNSWHIAATGDFDGNGHSDILWHNDSGALGVWDNGQTSGAHSIATVSTDWHIA